jgi:PAS domain S-box-containing protein
MSPANANPIEQPVEGLFVQTYLHTVALRLAISALTNPDLDAVISEAIDAIAVAVDNDSVHVVEVTSDGSPRVRAGTQSMRPSGSRGERDVIHIGIPGRIGSLGTLEVRPRLGRPNQDELEFLSSVAAILGSAIQRSRDDDALRQNEARFRMLADSVEDRSLIALDPDGRIVSWNPGAEKLWGRAADDVLGRHVTSLYARPGQRAGRLEGNLQLADRLGRLDFGAWFTGARDQKFFAEVSISPMKAEDGALLGFSHVTRLTSRSQSGREAKAVSRVQNRSRPRRSSRSPSPSGASPT